VRSLGGVIVLGLLAATCRIRVPAHAEEAGEFPCESAEECPAAPNACLLSACWDDQCVYVPAPEGTLPPEMQIAGDCQELSCDGQGEIRTSRAMRDLPADDGNPCTDALCELDSPRQAPRIAGSRCGAEGICNGGGICGVCLPREARCEGHAVATCSPEGAWAEAAACSAEAPRCHRAQCVGVVEIAAGGSSACARFSDGSVMCWGAPVGARGSSGGFDTVDFGPRHACGIRSGEVFCWGAGDWGQLGQGQHVSSEEPVATGVKASRIAVGHDHSCALALDGRVICWGRNDRGQSGQPSRAAASPERAPPVPSSSSLPAALVAEGATGLALNGPQICVRFGARLDCWATPSYEPPPDFDIDDADQAAQLAAREKTSFAKPTPIAQLVATAIDCGHDHCCAQIGDGSLRCWGAGDRGQLGSGHADAASPIVVPGVSARRFALGASFGCALTDEGVSCWGDDRRGQLGRGETASASPGRVPFEKPAVALSVGDDFACALLTGGEVSCWGAVALPERSPVAVEW
jgi:hypothetical protein